MASSALFGRDDAAWRELRRDPVFPWLSDTQQGEYIAGAVAIGREQAGCFQGKQVRSLAVQLGARVLIVDDGDAVGDKGTAGDNWVARDEGMAGDRQTAGDKPPPYNVMDGCVAGVPIFAEYDAGSRLITVYRFGIKAVARLLECADAERIALDLLIAHELFHHLEATRIGPVPDRLPPIFVPMFWGLFRARRRVRSTSEIAAQAFAQALIGLTLPLAA